MFRIGKSNTHGIGWFATRDIPAETSILDEEVCIRLPLDLSKDSGDPNLVEKLVSELPPEQQTSILALDGEDLLDKVWMNGSPMIDFETDPLGVGPRKNIGIYLQCARLNHSCVPNAVRASDVGNIMSVVSQKDIAAGDEITISYMDDNLVPSHERERQMRFKIRVGKFWTGCRCTLCTGPASQKSASDIRRRTLFSYREKLLQGKLSKGELAEGFLPLMIAEGLPVTLMGMNATMKMIHMMHGIDMTTASRESVHSISFHIGYKVRLHKLKARPDLNGKTAIVQYPLNKKTGRVGILLDSAKPSDKPIALKPENLISLTNRK
jgi:hypothetical protein